MANPELELISNIVKTGEFSSVRKRGLTPEFFQTEEGSDVFKWLWDQFHSAEHRGEVPDKARLMRKFPDFHWCPSRNSVEALFVELSQSHMATDLERIAGEILELLDDKEDPELIASAFLPQLRSVSMRRVDKSGMHMRDAFAELRQEYETVKSSGGITGIPYPWAPLNKATGGMHPEEFVVLYGRPKNMKTWVALKIAVGAYLLGYRVYIFSKEMNILTMARRSASIITQMPYKELKGAELEEDDEELVFETLEALAEWEEATIAAGRKCRDLYFDSDKGRRMPSSVDDLISRAEKFEPDLLVVDGLYLMRDGRTKSRAADWKNISHISQDLKGAAQYMECAVLGTTQANRANSKNPTDDGTDLSYADSLFQDCDMATRVFKGPNPDGYHKYAIAMTFPGVREADLNPFLINGAPGDDFDLIRTNVNMKSFLEQKKVMDAEEESAQGGGGAKKAEKKKKKPKSKRGGLRVS
jgi:replicative DNA helicase